MMATSSMGSKMAAVSHRRRSLPGGSSKPRSSTPQRRMDRLDRRRPGSTGVPLDRISMLVMEANEISQCLKKDYLFARDVEVPGNEERTLIRITNKKFGISCLWSLAKLKERLIKMRKLVYAGDVESSGFSGESVFYDPKDSWEKVAVTSGTFDVPTGPCSNGIDAIERAMEELSRQAVNTSLTNGSRAPDLPRRPIIRQRPNSAQAKISSFNGHSTGSSTSSELPADSEFIAVSLTGPAVNGDLALPEKYFISSPREEIVKHCSSNTSSSTPHMAVLSPRATSTQNAKQRVTTSTSSHGYGLQTRAKRAPVSARPPAGVDAGVQTEPAEPAQQNVSVLTICKEMVRLTTKRVQVGEEESLADRVLISCESIKVAVINILEGYTQAQEVGAGGRAFAESDLVRITSMQLVTSLELLVSQASLWVATYGGVELPVVQGVSANITKTVRELAVELLSFIQGCESDKGSVAHESSARILSLLYELARHCGELAMATDVCPSSLNDRYHDDELDGDVGGREEDITHILPSSDLKQAFLSGADSLVDHTLEDATLAVHECEGRAETLTHGPFHNDQGSIVDVLKHVYITVATSKLLVYKCREVQGELDTEMQEDCLRPANYYSSYFRRCQGIMSHVGALTDNLNLLVQTAQPLLQESDPATLKKLCRCAEIVQRTSSRLMRSASTDGDTNDNDQTFNLSLDNSVASSLNGLSLDLRSLKTQSSEVLLLSEDQSSQIGQSGDDVHLASKAIIDLTRKELALVGGLEVKVRRMLPATPSNIRPVVRPKSARCFERRKLDHNLSMRDVDTTGHT